MDVVPCGHDFSEVPLEEGLPLIGMVRGDSDLAGVQLEWWGTDGLTLGRDLGLYLPGMHHEYLSSQLTGRYLPDAAFAQGSAWR